MKRVLLIWIILLMTDVVRAAMTPDDQQMWWGYFSENDEDNLGYDGILGSDWSATVDVAILVPAGDELVGKSKIKAVRLWLGQDAKNACGDLTLWIATSLPTFFKQPEYQQTVSHDDLVIGRNEILLTTPFEVNDRAVYVGYTLTTKGQAYPVMGGGRAQSNAFFFRVTNSDWMDLFAAGGNYGSLALQLLLEGGTYPANSVVAADFGEEMVAMGSSIELPVTFTSRGKNIVRNIHYTVTTEGGSPSEEKYLYFLGGMAFNGSKTTYVSMAADETPCRHRKILTVTKVNGQPNEAAEKTAAGTLITLQEAPVAVPVVEEFTGTWCGYCPYGIVSMEQTRATYGDRVVLLAVHSRDVMECKDYAPILEKVESYPTASVNRSLDFNPQPSAMAYHIPLFLKRTTEAAVSMTAQWADVDRNLLDITVNSRFAYSDEGVDYGVAIVLVADGLTGTTSAWMQRNYLSGGSGMEAMQYWYGQGAWVAGLPFNHVVVAAYDIEKGADGSVSSKIVAGEDQSYTLRADLTSNTLIQDKENLSAVALLINRATGRIVNAAQTTILGVGTGISERVGGTPQRSGETVYTPDGRRLTGRQKGLNIVVTADGQRKKIWKK